MKNLLTMIIKAVAIFSLLRDTSAGGLRTPTPSTLSPSEILSHVQTVDSSTASPTEAAIFASPTDSLDSVLSESTMGPSEALKIPDLIDSSQAPSFNKTTAPSSDASILKEDATKILPTIQSTDSPSVSYDCSKPWYLNQMRTEERINGNFFDAFCFVNAFILILFSWPPTHLYKRCRDGLKEPSGEGAEGDVDIEQGAQVEDTQEDDTCSEKPGLHQRKDSDDEAECDCDAASDAMHDVPLEDEKPDLHQREDSDDEAEVDCDGASDALYDVPLEEV